MTVNIKQIDDDIIYVNEKRIQKDSNGNWVSPYDELTPSETNAFHRHLNAKLLMR